MTEAKMRDIVVTAQASSLEKWRKQVVAGQPETGSAFAFISDEGNYLPGGEGTAPTPLTYFVAGIALCLISHVTQVSGKKRLAIRNEKVAVTAHFHEEGSVLKGDAHGFCDSFEITISLESEEDEKEIIELQRLAHELCFAENALASSIPIETKLLLNDHYVEI